MNTKLISITPNSENQIAYCARVSNPNNQENPEFERLIKYLIKHKHWSPFEMGHATFEIETSRGVAAQILRHRSFSFQEFSQRYSEIEGYESYEARRQDVKNKQNSIDDMSETDKDWFKYQQELLFNMANKIYKEALERNIAKEQARFILPLSTKTRLYMSGNLRSWIHYVEVRSDVSTQKEHRDIAVSIKEQLKKEIPSIAKALEW